MRHEMLIEGATPEEDEIIGEHVLYLQLLTHEPCQVHSFPVVRSAHAQHTPDEPLVYMWPIRSWCPCDWIAPKDAPDTWLTGAWDDRFPCMPQTLKKVMHAYRMTRL